MVELNTNDTTEHPQVPETIEFCYKKYQALRADMVFPEAPSIEEEKIICRDYQKLKTPKKDNMTPEELKAFEWASDKDITDRLRKFVHKFIPRDRTQIHRLVHTEPVKLLIPMICILSSSILKHLGVKPKGGLLKTLESLCPEYEEVF